MKRVIILFVFALSSLIAFSQSQNSKTDNTEDQSTVFNFKRTIKLEKDNKEKEVMIKIEKQIKDFNLTIDTSVSSGKLTIEIYDSNGKKQGTFSVGTQLNIENSEQAQGNINKSLRYPRAGNWKVKIIPVNATGLIQINTATFH